MAAKTLRRWEATRSGSGLVVHGENHDTGEADKITNVVKIVPPEQTNAHEVVAIDRDGVRHRLIYLQ